MSLVSPRCPLIVFINRHRLVISIELLDHLESIFPRIIPVAVSVVVVSIIVVIDIVIIVIVVRVLLLIERENGSSQASVTPDSRKGIRRAAAEQPHADH